MRQDTVSPLPLVLFSFLPLSVCAVNWMEVTMKKIYKFYCKLETVLACAGFFTIIAMTFGNAVLRLMNKPIPTSDDICTLLFAWVSFLGADISMRGNRLVSMNLATM